MATALGLCWLAAAPGPATACGPFFPNWLLAEGDKGVLAPPETVFSKEVQRLISRATTNRSGVTLYQPRQTLEVELADLREALSKAGMAAGEREATVGRHRTERLRINVFTPGVEGTPDAESVPAWRKEPFVLRADPTNANRITGALPQITPGLPGEFADYFRGSIAWHQGNLPAARSAWLGLLKRPPAERHFKSTWAAFMLGKSWEQEDRSQSIASFEKVRELAREGFADSLGLAAASLGQEARLQWREGRSARAIDLYLDQAATGDPSAELSLRFAASTVLERGAAELRGLARHPRARALITAYVVSGGYRKDPIDVDSALKEAGLRAWEKAAARFARIPAPKANWHAMSKPVMLWLEAVEGAEVKDLESAELLALAAYQAGAIDTASRWLRQAPPSPLTQWLEAKLCLRDGRVEEAVTLLAKVCRHFPLEPLGTKAANAARAQGDLVVHTSPFFDGHLVASMAEETRAELGVYRLARRQFVEALDLLLHSSPDYWMDAAYVAERVLTLEELKAYVDRQWTQKPPPAQEPERNGSVPTSPADAGELPNHRYDYAYNYAPTMADPATTPSMETTRLPRYGDGTGEMIRYLLARRLARAWRLAEAGDYYPPGWRPYFDRLFAAWREAEQTDLPQMDRARALLKAATLTRKYGLELIGTEVEPDWRIHAGNFQEGVTLATRAGLQASHALGASAEEVERATQHGPTPEERWHYRRTAAVMAWEAARMMRDANVPGQPPEQRARALFEGAQTVSRTDISQVAVYIEYDRFLVGPETPAEGSLASRISRQSSQFFAFSANETTPRRATTNRVSPEILWRGGYTDAALAWDAAQLLPNNSDETARILCTAGQWSNWDPPVADLFYKSLVRRCRKTAIGAEADRIRWFPRIDAKGQLLPRKQPSSSPATAPSQEESGQG